MANEGLTISDDALIEELKKRFDQTKQALYDVKMVTRKLEAVNKKLEASEQVKSNFVSHMKNEINNPLTSILGLAQQIKSMGGDNPEMVPPLAEMIHAEAFSLDFQLRNIFSAAEVESGETDLQISILNVGNMINDGIDSFKHLIEEKKLTIEVNVEEPEVDPDAVEEPSGETEDAADDGMFGFEDDEAASGLLIKTDPEKLGLIFINLLSNAIEFNVEEGKIVINARKSGDTLQIQVTDTGHGVDSSKISRMFDRFVQMDTGVRKSHKGHGLGLSITKGLLDLMEGSISVDCNKDQGCTFTIAIPEVEMDIEADAFSVDGNEFFFDDDQIEAF
ncbi:MAG: HAMP domain-containing histidine kinase [Magnetococcales bacterium]|nr:HAMP domain-containing histidine kinase [Magnetococcales bacterium]